jgi:lactoylglutathione lyase
MASFREPFPIMYTDDVRRAARFYVETLGFELTYRYPPEDDEEPSFVYLRVGDHGIGIGTPTPQNTGRAFELCVYADSADAAAARLRAAGCDEVMAPRDEPWGERRTYFRDPDGNLLHVAQTL